MSEYIEDITQLETHEESPDSPHSPIIPDIIDIIRLKLSRLDRKFIKKDFNSLSEILTSEVWPEELINFAVNTLIPMRINEKTLSDFKQSLRLINENVQIENVDMNDYNVSRFLARRISFLKYLHSFLGQSTWNELLKDSQMCGYYARIAYLGAPIYRLSDEVFDNFAARDSINIESKLEDRKNELEEVLRHTGLYDIALILANKIIFNKPKSNQSAHGNYNVRTADINVCTGKNKKELLIPILLHELGHALESRISRDDAAREIFDEYIVLSQFEKIKHSPYVESFELSSNKSNPDYIHESFAEDFRLYLLKPESLSVLKLDIFNRFFSKFLSNIDAEKIHKQIKSVLGNFYGVSVNDVFQTIDCYNARDLVLKRLYKDRQK